MDTFVSIMRKDQVVDKKYLPAGHHRGPTRELIPALSGVSEQDEAIVPGLFIGRGRTGSVFDAAFESWVDLGFPVVIKYAGRNIDTPYHPLMNEFAIHNVMADTGATLRMVYLSPVMKSHDDEPRFIVMETGGIAFSEYAALFPNRVEDSVYWELTHRPTENISRPRVNAQFRKPGASDPITDDKVLIDLDYSVSIGGLDRASSEVAEIPQCMFELSTGLSILAYGDRCRTREQIEHTEELE
jgi:hypothetical protein